MVTKTGSHGAERKEGRVCTCESTEGGKGLLFLIYDFTYNYKSYITLLCWPSSVCPTGLSPSFPTLLSAHEADPHGPLTGVP